MPHLPHRPRLPRVAALLLVAAFLGLWVGLLSASVERLADRQQQEPDPGVSAPPAVITEP